MKKNSCSQDKLDFKTDFFFFFGGIFISSHHAHNGPATKTVRVANPPLPRRGRKAPYICAAVEDDGVKNKTVRNLRVYKNVPFSKSTQNLIRTPRAANENFRRLPVSGRDRSRTSATVRPKRMADDRAEFARRVFKRLAFSFFPSDRRRPTFTTCERGNGRIGSFVLTSSTVVVPGGV